MVIVAWFPTCTWETEVLDTEVLTMYEPVETTTTWALDELDAAEDEDAEDDEDEAPPEDPPPNDPLPEEPLPEEPLEPDPDPDPLLPVDPEVALPEEAEPATC
jgi:protein TonB